MQLTPDIRDFINQHLHERVDQLVLKIRKQFNTAPDFILQQINGRKKVGDKIPAWAGHDKLLFPSVVSFEQCSSEKTAFYKSKLIGGNHLVDVTGGFGVDTFFMGQQFEEVDYVEQEGALAAVVRHNFQVLGASHIRVHIGDGIDFLKNSDRKADWVFIDPARRGAENKRVFLMEDSEPDIMALAGFLLTKSNRVLVKLSPMLDLEEIARKVDGVTALIVVAVQNECKEILAILENKTVAFDEIVIKTVDLRKDGTERHFNTDFYHQKNSTVPYANPLDHIYEPNRAVLKAGVQNHLAQSFGLQKIAANSHFYTSNQMIRDYPGRRFAVIQCLKPKKQALYNCVPHKKANIIARNYPLKASELYQKFKITPGGDHYVLATTLQDTTKVLMICRKW